MTPPDAPHDPGTLAGGLVQPRLFRKRRKEFIGVTETSIALFRLGEQCNYRCPMCSNSGRPEAFFIKTPELLRRVEHLAEAGFRRVVLTGGEPTIHPGMWEVVAALRERGMEWDCNTHGGSFADADLARRAAKAGLKRAIVSVHSHRPDVSAAIFGVSESKHEQTVQGIANLAATKVRVLLNAVVTRLNADHLAEYVRWVVDQFGTKVRMKIAFPSTSGKGGEWPEIHIRYEEIKDEIARVREAAVELGASVDFESFPNCVLGARDAWNVSRSGFGETHYLEDIEGMELYSIRHIEAVLSLYPETCQTCAALEQCPGVAVGYAKRWGTSELVPFSE